MHAPVVDELIDDEALRIVSVTVGERLERGGDRRIRASREPGVTAKQPRPFEMMAGLADAPGDPLSRGPGAVEILGQDSGPALEEARGHQVMELRGAGEEHFVARRLEP